MGKLFKVDLSGPRVYACTKCRCHLAKSEDIVSKSFTGRHGRAYLFSSVVNVAVGKHEERMLLTGMHTVADVVCIVCDTVVGWKYVRRGPLDSWVVARLCRAHVLFLVSLSFYGLILNGGRDFMQLLYSRCDLLLVPFPPVCWSGCSCPFSLLRVY